MPELPDVELFKRIAEQHGLGRRIARADMVDPGSLDDATPAGLQRQWHNQPLRTVRRHGKVLFLEAGDLVLAMHFGTNGSLQYLADGEAEPGSVRLWLHFADGGRLAYLNPRRIGHVQAVRGIDAFIKETGLGPDVLEAAFDLAAFAAAIDGRRQAIKPVLMDQQRMAGIGNIYADEILFQAKLHPATPANALDKATARRMFQAVRSVMQTAIDCGAGAESFTDRLPKGFLLPERHAGGRCPRCGTAIQLEKRGGRTGYFCPKCQPPPD
ncbi:MAG TPA: DNA-formamidopyrimidine glycosylase family protein [Acetobacteraceae bacterium]|jgi:formamidopyrimidine-DNA glycosylase